MCSNKLILQYIFPVEMSFRGEQIYIKAKNHPVGKSEISLSKHFHRLLQLRVGTLKLIHIHLEVPLAGN
jgi:hypothetical protein